MTCDVCNTNTHNKCNGGITVRGMAICPVCSVEYMEMALRMNMAGEIELLSTAYTFEENIARTFYQQSNYQAE